MFFVINFLTVFDTPVFVLQLVEDDGLLSDDEYEEGVERNSSDEGYNVNVFPIITK